MRALTDVTILPLSVRDLVFDAGGKRLLKSLNFTIGAGARTAILGPNGAGKSLLLRICHGLVPPTSGEVVWEGAGSFDPRTRQAMVFQRPVMLRRSASDNVAFALGARGVPRAERKERSVAALKATKLMRHAGRAARVLSVGEQQRLALARAWALGPEVMFLDEPTASLDPAVTRTIETLINAIHQSGTKIILTTHDLGQARRLADEVIFLHRGRLLEQTPADEFFARPRSEAARAFITGDLFW